MSGFTQGLLSSLQPWMTGSSPSALDNAFSQYGGTQGLLAALEQGAGPQTSQARTGAALQRAQLLALGQAQQRQNLATGAFGLQRMEQSWPLVLRAIQGLSGGGQGSPSTQPQSGTPAPASPMPVSGGNSGAPGASPAGGSPGPVSPDAAAQALNAARTGAIMGLAGFPGGQGLSNYAKLQLQYNPSITTELAAAKNPLAQDLALMRTYAAQGNPQAAEGAYFKFLKDSGQVNVAGWSGNVTTLGGITPQQLGVNAFLPSRGITTAGGTAMPIPGFPGAMGQIAAAEQGGGEAGKLRAQTAPAGSISPYIALPPGSVPQKQASNVAPLGYQGADAVQQANYIPPILAAPSNIQQSPGNTSLGELKAAQEGEAENAKEDQQQLNEQSAGAQTLLTQAGLIDNAARDFTPGKLANVKRELMAWGQQFGMLSPGDLKSLGSAQEGDKLSIQLQAAVTKALGSREAAQVFSVMGRSIPNLTLSPDGLAKISAYLKGIARYQQSMNTFGQRLMAAGNVAGMNGLQSNFQTYTNPVYYILGSAPTKVAQELIANMAPNERAKIQAGWKKAISMGLAPAPGDYQ